MEHLFVRQGTGNERLVKFAVVRREEREREVQLREQAKRDEEKRMREAMATPHGLEATGTVKRWFDEPQYGFIRPDGGGILVMAY